MKNITDVLNKVGKASTREIAAILDIDVRDMLALLQEHQQEGLVESINGHWQLAKAHTEPENGIAQATNTKAAAIPAEGEAEAQAAALVPAAEPASEPATPAPLKVIWSLPGDVQEFPTLTWVRQRRRELKNEMRWLSQIENIARQIDRKKAAVAYFREHV